MTELRPEAIRAGRAILKWTVRDLAAAAGVSPNTVNQAEMGKRPTRKSTAAKIAAAFEARGVELLDGDAPGARVKPQP